MLPHNVFFFGAVFFLLGVFLKSIGLAFAIIPAVSLLIASCLIFFYLKKDRKLLHLAALSLFILAGSLYYTWDDLRLRGSDLVFDRNVEFTGMIRDKPADKITYREGVLELDDPFSGRVILRTSAFEIFDYGDRVRVKGIIERPFTDWYADYLAKERISGVVAFPDEIEVVKRGLGSRFKGFLFGLRDRISDAYKKTLPAKESAFLSGITLGDRTKFSREFLDAMSSSGTTHLTALSGLHISIIVFSVSFLFASFLGRRRAFFPLLIFLFSFVVMTGARPSVIRAAIMGGLVLAAFMVGREYYFRNSVVLAALFLVLLNPKMLYFDLGFQLSFLALLGIVYLRPAMIRILRISEEPGFLSWRNYLLVTISAQLAVAPLIISSFDSFSPISFLANTLILAAVPPTMILGFLVFIFSFISHYLSLFLAWLVLPLLKFEVGMIEFFGKFDAPVMSFQGWPVFLVYYIILITLIIYINHKDPILTRSESEIFLRERIERL